MGNLWKPIGLLYISASGHTDSDDHQFEKIISLSLFGCFEDDDDNNNNDDDNNDDDNNDDDNNNDSDDDTC